MTKLQFQTIMKSEYLRKIGLHENVPIVNAHISDDKITVKIYCPYCGCIHTHGADKSIDLTHRSSHCYYSVKNIGGYWLKKTQEPMPQEAINAAKKWNRIHKVIERRGYRDTGINYNINSLIQQAAEQYEN